MEKNEIIEGNKLIAEFDGWKRVGSASSSEDLKDIPFYKKFDNNGKVIHDGIYHHPTYHDNWSTLMPVVEKIGKLTVDNKFVEVELKTNDTCVISIEDVYFEEEAEDTLIKATWQAVVDFIKWYNTQLTTNPKQ